MFVGGSFLATGNRLELEFADSNNSIFFIINCAKSNATAEKVKALMNSIITNRDIFANVPVTEDTDLISFVVHILILTIQTLPPAPEFPAVHFPLLEYLYTLLNFPFSFVQSSFKNLPSSIHKVLLLPHRL